MRTLDLGRLGYREAWDRQLQVVDGVRDGGDDTLIFVEHPPVLTLGANFHAENLLYDEEEYARRGIEIVRTDRGGDVTYHGPGQLVIYPIFNLERHGKDLHRYLRNLEETMIATCRHFGLDAGRRPPHTGAWIGREKVAAIGIKVRRWVTLHGIALNCENPLDVFEWFIPCGLRDFGVTSLSAQLGRTVGIDEAKPVVESAFAAIFR